MALLRDRFGELGRKISATEEDILRHISPQGIAKINRDVTKGISLDQTLSEITAAFDYMKQRRKEVEGKLPESAWNIVSLMRRPPSTNEMAMLSEVPAPVVMAKVEEQLKTGEEFEDVIEDLASNYCHHQLLNHAKTLADMNGLPISIIKLAPTIPPTSANLTAPNMAKFCHDRIFMGPSPIAVWFDELASGKDYLRQVLDGTVPSPQTLKKARSPKKAADSVIAAESSIEVERRPSVTFSFDVVQQA